MRGVQIRVFLRSHNQHAPLLLQFLQCQLHGAPLVTGTHPLLLAPSPGASTQCTPQTLAIFTIVCVFTQKCDAILPCFKRSYLPHRHRGRGALCGRGVTSSSRGNATRDFFSYGQRLLFFYGPTAAIGRPRASTCGAAAVGLGCRLRGRPGPVGIDSAAATKWMAICPLNGTRVGSRSVRFLALQCHWAQALAATNKRQPCSMKWAISIAFPVAFCVKYAKLRPTVNGSSYVLLLF